MKNTFVLLFVVLSVFLFTGCNPGSSKKAEIVEPDAASVEKPQPGRYCNEKYGFCFTYPEDAFMTEEGGEDENGTVLVSDDGLARVVIHVGNLDGEITEAPRLKEAYEKDILPRGKRELTYKTFATTSYTLMGYEVRTIFYQKTIISKGTIVTAVFYYDDKVKDTYYPMLEPMFKSFR